jgi:TPR repeat protein
MPIRRRIRISLLIVAAASLAALSMTLLARLTESTPADHTNDAAQPDGAGYSMVRDRRSGPAPPQSRQGRRMIGSRAFRLGTSMPSYDGSALDYVRQRERASNDGNAQASYEIFMRIDSCKRAIQSNDADLYRAYDSIGMSKQYSERIERSLEQCSDIGTDAGLLSKEWLSIAAEQGSIEAQLIYAMSPEETLGTTEDMLRNPAKTESYRNNAVRYLQEAASQGSLDAVAALGRAYDAGIIIERSPIQSHAYQLAAQRADYSLSSELKLDELKKSMSSADINIAETKANLIYIQCCTP